MKTMISFSRQCRLRTLGTVTAGVLAAGALFCQSPAVRIGGEISSSGMTVLRGSQHPLAAPEYEAGRVPAATRMGGVTLYFNRSAAQQASLLALMAAQDDPSSAQYHKWITPDQYAARFGMAPADIDIAKSWLERQGFTIDSVMRSRTGIRFSGTVGQVEQAFQTEMHYYVVGGEKHMAPSTDLSLPSALGAVTAAVRNLDDFQPKAQHINARPNFTSGSSGNVFFSPGDIVTAYDIKPLYTAGVNGAGQTIAIMGQSYVNVADVEAFQKAAGLAKKDPQLVYVPGTGSDGVFSPGDESESDLDLEWSSGVAPGANVVFVYTGSDTHFGVYDSAQYAVDNLIGNIISLSYASCETEVSSTNLTTLEAVWTQAKTQGQTVMSASGDQGSTACYGVKSLTMAQQQALAVNYPASSAYVTGVGGTSVTTNDTKGGSNYSTYWNSTSGTDIVSSLKAYVPEIVWNDDPTSGCQTGQNCLSATGGGTSTLVARPSWQTGVPGIPSGSMRLVPDIAFYSSPGLPGYLYCTSDSTAWQSGQTASCNSGFRDSTSNNLTVAGGTSFATPIFAGMVALLNQNGKYVSGAGEINAMLYTLAANSATYAAVFHDVTQGNNFCLTPSNCASNGATLGFSANAGYDQVTGLGSVDLNALAAVWPVNSGSSATLVTTTTGVAPSNPTPNIGDTVTFNISVAPQSGSGTPTGTVTLQVDGGTTFGGTTKGPFALSGGTYADSETFSTTGTHQVLAQYTPDAASATVFAASTGIGQVSIVARGKFTVAATNVSVNRGSTGTSTITVTPTGGYTGTVLLTLDFGSQDSALGNLCFSWATQDSSGKGTVQVTGTAAVTNQLSLDTKASDCVSGMAVKGKGMRSFGSLKGAKAGNRTPGKPGDERVPAGIAFAGLLLAGLLGRYSRKLRNVACLVALASAFLAISACSSSSGGGGGPSNPPKGTYTGTVTGADSVTSSITANGTFTFTIN